MSDENKNIWDFDEDTSEEQENIKSENLEESQNNEIIISKSKIALVKNLLENIKENNEKLIQIFSSLLPTEDEQRIKIGQLNEVKLEETTTEDGQIIEGVFDGENMIGPDGKQYSVPANYASKSKLVEGDILKLTITSTGTFIYRQIGPIERNRIIGSLEKNSDGHFLVNAEGKKWRVLPASVTYYKGRIGDEVVLLIPKTGESKWAAVENIIRNKEQTFS